MDNIEPPLKLDPIKLEPNNGAKYVSNFSILLNSYNDLSCVHVYL